MEKRSCDGDLVFARRHCNEAIAPRLIAVRGSLDACPTKNDLQSRDRFTVKVHDRAADLCIALLRHHRGQQESGPFHWSPTG